MKLKHLHLMVTDVREASTFLERYFDLQNGDGNEGLAFLLDQNGLVMTMMKIGRTGNKKYPCE